MTLATHWSGSLSVVAREAVPGNVTPEGSDCREVFYLSGIIACNPGSNFEAQIIKLLEVL